MEKLLFLQIEFAQTEDKKILLCVYLRYVLGNDTLFMFAVRVLCDR